MQKIPIRSEECASYTKNHLRSTPLESLAEIETAAIKVHTAQGHITLDAA